MEYPKTLYVTSESPYHPYTTPALVGRGNLESAVLNNHKENEVAVYELVSVNKYKKTVTAVVEQVK